MKNIVDQLQLDYLQKFRKEEEQIILDMEFFAKENNIPILDLQSAEFLELLIQLLKPKRVLEIGTAIAYSSIRIARSLSKKGILHTIEKSKDNIERANENILKSGLQNKITLFEGEAKEIIPTLDKKYDLIFLDADKEDYKYLFDYLIIMLKKNGLIFIDNLLWHGFVASLRVPKNFKKSTKHIREFNEYFMNYPNLKTTILTIGDGIGLGIKTKNI